MNKKTGKVLDFAALKKGRWEAVFTLELPTRPGRHLLSAAFEELVRGLDHLPFPRSAKESRAACAFVRRISTRLCEILYALGQAPTDAPEE